MEEHLSLVLNQGTSLTWHCGAIHMFLLVPHHGCGRVVSGTCHSLRGFPTPGKCSRRHTNGEDAFLSWDQNSYGQRRVGKGETGQDWRTRPYTKAQQICFSSNQVKMKIISILFHFKQTEKSCKSTEWPRSSKMHLTPPQSLPAMR